MRADIARLRHPAPFGYEARPVHQIAQARAHLGGSARARKARNQPVSNLRQLRAFRLRADGAEVALLHHDQSLQPEHRAQARQRGHRVGQIHQHQAPDDCVELARHLRVRHIPD